MPDTLFDRLNKWRTVVADLQQMAGDIVVENGEKVDDLIRAQLYEHGEDGYGHQLTPQYQSKSYARKKYGMNPAPGYGVPDLKLKGDFYRGIAVQVSSGNMVITSTDRKTDWLVKGSRLGYGEGVFKLLPENVGVVRKTILQPNLVDQISNRTGALVE
jgi:hypothetical protein